MPAAPPPHLLPALTALRHGDLPSARREADRAAQDHVDDPVLQHLLGVICCRLGDLPAGIRHLEVALASTPADDGVRLMLARAHVDAGQPQAALALSSGRSEPEFTQVAAEAARAAGDTAAEAAALGLLVASRPTDPALRRAHAHALANAGDLLAASAALDMAVQLDPTDVGSRAELAAMLSDLGEPESALAAFSDALAQAPQRADLHLGRARALTRLRRFDEAADVYAGMLGSDPADSVATREYGVLLERTGRVAELPGLVETAVANGIARDHLVLLDAILALQSKEYDRALDLARRATDDDPVKVQRLIAKIEESRGDIKAAFAAAVAMNAAAPDRDRWLQRGADARREIRRLAQAMRAADDPRIPEKRGDRPSPAFIVGFPRSGTTLLDTILMGHPDVAVLEEEPMLEAAKAVVGDLAQLDSVDTKTINTARAAYFQSLDARLDPAFAGLVVDKMPFNMLGAGLIHRLFPDARFIFAQRHPCDVVLSGFMQSFRLNDGMASFLDLDAAADLYDAAMDLWTESRGRVPIAVHDLVYEDLVEAPEAVLRPLIAFLGLAWDDALLDHRSTARERGMIITPSYDQVTQPINRRAAGRWLKLREDMASVLPVLRPWAERLGYPASDFSSASSV